MNTTGLCVTIALLLAGCSSSEGGSAAQPAANALPPEGKIASVPLGDVAGAPASTVATEIANPFLGNPEAVAEGKALFSKMNCAGCHGYTVEGAMGPDLTDQYWRYGGTPVEVFKSIYEGRPQGMPAWGTTLPPEEIWKIVAYVQSLGGTFPDASFQAARQGDRPKMNVAPEVAAPPIQPNQMKAQAVPTPSAPTGGGGGEAGAAPGQQAGGGAPGTSNPTSGQSGGSIHQGQAMPPR